MQIPFDIGISALIAGGVTFGIMKGTLSSFITHKDHREICHSKSDETNKMIQRLFEKIDDTRTKIDKLQGYIEGKLK